MTSFGPPQFRQHKLNFVEEDKKWTVICSCGSFKENSYSTKYDAAIAGQAHKARREVDFH